MKFLIVNLLLISLIYVSMTTADDSRDGPEIKISSSGSSLHSGIPAKVKPPSSSASASASSSKSDSKSADSASKSEVNSDSDDSTDDDPKDEDLGSSAKSSASSIHGLPCIQRFGSMASGIISQSTNLIGNLADHLVAMMNGLTV